MGSGVLIWGAIAALWLLILGADLFDSASHCAHLNPWLFLRIPVLAAASLGLAVAAATFLTARRMGRKRGS